MSVSTKEIFKAMEARLQVDSSKVAGLTATYKFELTGEDGGVWHVKIDNGNATVAEGEPEKADCTITMEASDFKSMIAGELNPITAFSTGKLRIQGDMSLAVRLQSLLG